MGIEINTARFLVWARLAGVDFSRTVTLGRQGLNGPFGDLWADVRRHPDLQASSQAIAAALKENYAEEFFSCLGASDVTSIDASEYEGASLRHDMNLPLTAERKFSFLFDGGTLEHVFNSAVSFENCMNLVSVGGHVLHVLPANNLFGHGFYQFSAEFFFRLYSAENGWTIDKMLLVEDCPGGRWHQVADPATVRSRVVFSNCMPTYIFALAHKIEDVRGIRVIPQQSDYEQMAWKGEDYSARKNRLRDFVRNILPVGLSRLLLLMRHLFVSDPHIRPFRLYE